MFPYYAIAACLGAASLCERFLKDRRVAFLLVLSTTVLLTLFAGLRAYVGPDQMSYEETFYDVPSLFEWGSEWEALKEIHGEYGYLLVNSLVKLWSADPVLLFVVIALLAVGINLYSYYKYSPYALLSVYIYFTHIFLYKEMIQIRNGVASAIVLFGVQYIVDRKPWKYFWTVLAAMSFHVGTVVALLAYWVKDWQLRRRRLLWTLGGAVVLAHVHWLGKCLGLLVDLGVIPYRISAYIGWDLYDYSLGVFTNPTTVKQLVVCLLCLHYAKSLDASSRYFRPMFFMYFLSTIWILLFNDLSILAARIASNLSVVEPVLVANFLLVRKRCNHILILVVLLAYALILFLNLEVKSLLLPYDSVLGL